MLKTVQKPVNECACDLCKHTWDSLTIPSICPACRSRQWNGGKTRGRPSNKPAGAGPKKAKKPAPKLDLGERW